MIIASILVLATISGCNCSCHRAQPIPRWQERPFVGTRPQIGAYSARERQQAKSEMDAINTEYYRRSGTKPTPYWDMPN